MLDTGDCAVEEESAPVTKRGEWEVTYDDTRGRFLSSV